MRAPDGWPTWERPQPYGIAEAIGAAGTVAAPLLAGFSVSLIALTLELTQPSAPARPGVKVVESGGVLLPDLALTLLVIAAASLLGAVQCAFWARQYQVTPAEIHDWWGGFDELCDPKVRSSWETARKEQIGYVKLQGRWMKRFRVAYHAGILAVLAALAALLVPRGEISPGRWAAIALTLAAILVEVIWIVATEVNARRPYEPSEKGLLLRGARAIAPPLVPGLPGDLDPELLREERERAGQSDAT